MDTFACGASGIFNYMASSGFEVQVKKEPGMMEESDTIPNESTDSFVAPTDACKVQGIITPEEIISQESVTHALVVKRECFPSESAGGLLAQTETISGESNSNESKPLNESFHLNKSAHMVKRDIMPSESIDVLTVKKENDCKRKITYELVNFRLTREEQILDAPVKTEDSSIITQNENEGDQNCTVLNEPSLFSNSKSATSSSKVKRHITIVMNVVESVELVDIFSENDRKRGTAHSIIGPCQCVFCQPDYNWGAVSLLVRKNLQSQERLMSARSQYKLSLPHKYQITKESWGKNGKKLYTRKCKCPECGVICVSSSILEVHMRKHTGERPFKCKKCPASFKRNSHLECHMRIKHSNARPFHCDECPLAFKDKSDLMKHVKLHSDERPFSCKICGSAFKRSTHLKSHMTKHMEFSERPFKCTLCPLTFTRNYLLNQHMRVHHDQNPFKCKECPCAFRTYHLLKRHLIAHGGNPFPCHVCGMSFMRRAELRFHVTQKHDAVRRFTCDICSASFKGKTCLKEHIQRLHFDPRAAKYKCDICKSKFHTKPAIRSHMMCHTSDIDKKYKCDKCSSKFNTKYGLRQHLLTHTDGALFTCSSCSVAFINERCLNRHIDKHHKYKNEDRKFSCTICSEAFVTLSGLQTHVRRSHSDKNFECDKCQKKFKTKGALGKHLKRSKHLLDKDLSCVLQKHKKLNL